MARIRASLWLAVAFLLLLAGAASAQTHPTLKDAKLPPLLPLALVAGDDADTRSNFQISPDSKWLAWSQRYAGRSQIHVRPIGGGDAVIVRTPTGSSNFRWLPDSRRLRYGLDNGGNENTQIWVVDSLNPNASPKNLTPWAGTTNFVSTTRLDGDEVLLFSNHRDRRMFDAYRVSLSGDLTPVLHERNPGTVDRAYFDRKARMVARTLRPGADGKRAFEFCPGAASTCARVFDMEWDEQITVPDIAAGEEEVWALSNRGRDRQAVVKLNLRTGVETVMHEDPKVDVDAFWFNTETREPVLAVKWPDRQRLHAFGSGLGPDLAAMGGDGAADVVSILSWDNAMRWFVLGVQSKGSATRTILYDAQNKERTLLTAGPWDAYRESLSPITPVEYKARDGLTINAYLTLPAGAPAKNLPAVVFVHGGPWLRDIGTLSTTAQFLANRGYAVLQLNYRGSNGYGRAFLRAGIGELGGKTQDDVDDGAKWLIAQGIADPARIALMGSSYGGFSTFVGMTRTPTLYAVGVANVGITDIPAFIDLVPEYWDRSRWNRFLGPSNTAEGRAALWQRSPLAQVQKLERPMLITAGANDVRVRKDQSERFYGAARALGKTVEFHLFENEGHSFYRAESRLIYFAKVEIFLAKYLGGRATEVKAPPPPRATVPPPEHRTTPEPAPGVGSPGGERTTPEPSDRTPSTPGTPKPGKG
ncbi:MAG: S9 family peptidase [Alphaproteobacteria bacterium]|nr:S9 family peptidase [Alphaproteobacteria bacterium]